MLKKLERLREIQKKVAREVSVKDSIELANVKTIAGFDLAYMKNKLICAATVLSYPDLKVIEKKHIIADQTIPYIPGFLGFREGPPIIELFGKLENKPDVIVVDGHGIAHPLKCGLATYVGVQLNVPAIGVAKKKYVGDIKDDKLYIKDELRARLIKTREHAKPLLVSAGHRISLKSAVEIISRSIIQPHKLPEQLHIAHRHADKVRVSIESGGVIEIEKEKRKKLI